MPGVDESMWGYLVADDTGPPDDRFHEYVPFGLQLRPLDRGVFRDVVGTMRRNSSRPDVPEALLPFIIVDSTMVDMGINPSYRSVSVYMDSFAVDHRQ